MGIFGSIFSGVGLWVALVVIAAAGVMFAKVIAAARRDKTIRSFLLRGLLLIPLLLMAGVAGTFEPRDGVPLLVILIVIAVVGLCFGPLILNRAFKQDDSHDSPNT